ncbi:hypothetical protein D8S78_01120 [Natrialba swarupiae]|nr:hypothetical protein [Natrialba swarupiae]
MKRLTDYHQYTIKCGRTRVDVTKQLKVSDAVYDELDELKDEEGHTSFDSVLRTLLLHYRHVQPNDQE